MTERSRWSAPVAPGVAARPSLRRWLAIGTAIVVVALGATAWWWWYRAGPTLRLTSASVSATAPPGRIVNVGFAVRVAGGSVTVEHVRVDPVPGLRIRFVGVDAAADLGVGVTTGGVAHRIPLAGMRLPGSAADPTRSRQIVMRVTAARAGVYAVGGVRVDYRAGPRTRTANADASLLCLTVVRPGSPRPAPDPFLARCGGAPD